MRRRWHDYSLGRQSYLVESEGAPAPHDKERDMAQELLLEKLEGLASRARLVEGEKAKAVARIQEL